MVLGWLACAAGACAPSGLCAGGLCFTNCQLAICAFSVDCYLLVLPAPVPLRACATAASASVMHAILHAPPGALIKYQIATYLCCNPQDASYEVEDSSWEDESIIAAPLSQSLIAELKSALNL